MTTEGEQEKIFKYPTESGVEWTVDDVQAYYELRLSSLMRLTEKYKTALEFYADEEKYHYQSDDFYPAIEGDQGDIAREALK